MKTSAFVSARKSMIAGSFKPRSIFQSTTRTELRGHHSHWLGAKFSARISFTDTIKLLPFAVVGIHFVGQTSGLGDRRILPKPRRLCCYSRPVPSFARCCTATLKNSFTRPAE